VRGQAAIWIGAVTVALFLGLGGLFLAEGRTWVGGAIAGLGAFRAVVLARQIAAARTAQR
jgi:hypothetical protein